MCCLSVPPRDVTAEDAALWRAKSGRPVPGMEVRLVDDAGEPVAHDGAHVGNLQLRGPWVTGRYHRDASPDSFTADGWLRTGDVGTIDAHGYVQITDRSKDVIKSGGEWVSSVDLENQLAAHPAVLEAAVIGVPDPRWEERPLALVVVRDDETVDPAGVAVVPSRPRRALLGARVLGVRAHVAKDQRWQDRQEGAASPARCRQLRRADGPSGSRQFLLQKQRGRLAAPPYRQADLEDQALATRACAGASSFQDWNSGSTSFANSRILFLGVLVRHAAIAHLHRQVERAERSATLLRASRGSASACPRY
jgi:acyl-CoA synthetase (AMP-forming)/AMP-acid ligase II